MVITGLTRNQFAGNRTWVRIPPAAPKAPEADASGAFFILTGERNRRTCSALCALIGPILRFRKDNQFPLGAVHIEFLTLPLGGDEGVDGLLGSLEQGEIHLFIVRHTITSQVS